MNPAILISLLDGSEESVTHDDLAGGNLILHVKQLVKRRRGHAMNLQFFFHGRNRYRASRWFGHIEFANMQRHTDIVPRSESGSFWDQCSRFRNRFSLQEGACELAKAGPTHTSRIRCFGKDCPFRRRRGWKNEPANEDAGVVMLVAAGPAKTARYAGILLFVVGLVRHPFSVLSFLYLFIIFQY
jgi:hypothetical protein